MRKKLYATLGFILLITVGLILYLGHREQSTIKIGLVADLSGSMALYGNWVKLGAEIAITEFDDDGIVLLIEDSKSDPKTAVSSFTKLISFDKINFCIAGNNSSGAMSMAPIADKEKVILFSTLASSPSLTGASEYMFRNRISGIFEAESMAKTAALLKPKKVAVIATNNDAGLPYIEAFKNEFVKLTRIDVLGILVEPNAISLNTQALQLKDYYPDVIFVVMPIPQVINLIRSAHEIDYRPQWLGISSLKADEFLRNGSQYIEGTIIANEGVDETNQLYIEFARKYKAKFGEDPTIYAVNGYDAFKILVGLAKIKNGNIEEMRKALQDSDGFYTASGHIHFDNNGDVIKSVELLKVHNGKFEKFHIDIP